MTYKLEETTVRDYGGGWDVSDSDKSLGSKFQPVSDNVVRQTDGSFSIRPGTQLFADMRQGTETVVAAASYPVTTTAGGTLVKINKTAHGLVNGNHINITSWVGSVGGLVASDVLGVHGIQFIDANNFYIFVRKAGITAGGPTGITIGYTSDTHALGGRDIYGRYFSDNLIVFSDIGEIVRVDGTATVTPLWNAGIAAGKAPVVPPWGPCRRISAEIIKGRLIAVNGATNDKPLEILPDISGVLQCNYLLDGATPGSGGNTSIPKADFVIAADRYALYVSTERGPTKVDVTAANTYNVTDRNTTPADAKEIDLGMVTQSVETTILGANVIRAKVFIAFHDRSQLGELGTYDSVGVHTPSFKDNIAMLGSFSHASIVSLGNDLLCAAINGINSLSISAQSGEFTPATISDLIHPVLLRHLGRLSEDDRRYRTFAVWDSNFRSYMLFVPKYSAVTYTCQNDPIIISNTLQPSNLVFLTLRSHALDAGDYITIAGVANSPDGYVPGSKINGTRRIRAIADEDTVVVEVDTYQPGLNYAFGGNSVTVAPVNDETIGYVYEYNARMKIKRWTRFRGMDWDWGTVSQLSRLFFGKNGRIYKYGNSVDKFSADKIGDYTKKTWANSTAYAIGDRVLDSTYKQVYLCLIAHTSPAAGTFKDARDATPTQWTEFVGNPINWEMETSWTDFKDRMANKQIEVVRFDTKGKSEFSFSIYTNSIREDFETWELIPRRTSIFIGEDAPGWGAGAQPFGGGRNTRQEWLRGMPVEGKMFRLRFEGSSTEPLTIASATMYYHKKPTALT